MPHQENKGKQRTLDWALMAANTNDSAVHSIPVITVAATPESSGVIVC